MRFRRGPAMPVLLCLLTAACTDVQLPAEDDGGGTHSQDLRTYETIEEIPPEQKLAYIISASTELEWSAASLNGRARMEAFGNRFDQVVGVTIIHEYSTVMSRTLSFPVSKGHIPARWFFSRPFTVTVAESCGQTGTANTQHSARTVFFLNTGVTTLSQASHNTDADAVQPECTCPSEPISAPEGHDVYSAEYDPYAPTTGSLSDCSGGDGGTKECETVWVKVEVSDDNGVTWSTLWEGYATVCS